MTTAELMVRYSVAAKKAADLLLRSAALRRQADAHSQRAAALIAQRDAAEPMIGRPLSAKDKTAITHYRDSVFDEAHVSRRRYTLAGTSSKGMILDDPTETTRRYEQELDRRFRAKLFMVDAPDQQGGS